MHNKSVKTAYAGATFITAQDLAAMAAFLTAFKLKHPVKKLKVKKKR
ncbi:MAG: hypothetical protein QM687_08585 [Ferruginibacter sp.]